MPDPVVTINDIFPGPMAIAEAKRISEDVAKNCKKSDDSLAELVALTKKMEGTDPMVTPGLSMFKKKK